jgi:hypothetical protein
MINPLVFFERFIGTYFSHILPPRAMIGHWRGIDFYHTEFAKTELVNFFRHSGFEIYFIETEFSEKLEFLKKVPVFKYMGHEFYIVAKAC